MVRPGDMTSKRRLQFDPRALKDFVGDRAFARAEAYARDGNVEILESRPDRVLARVAGAEDYRTVITGQGTTIGGECSCPAFAREGGCKHMVAVALTVNAAVTSGEIEGGGVFARIRAYLKTRDVDALVEMIMHAAERDSALLSKLKIGAAAANTSGPALDTQLRAAIGTVTRIRGFIDYNGAAAWAAGVDAALDMLVEIASGEYAARAIALADFAISRIERAIESVDDGDGHCSALLARARRIHCDACRLARPDPVSLARDLFLRETEGDYDTFHAAAAQYADALGEEGLAEYRHLAQAAWDKLPARIGSRRDDDRFEANGDRLASILDFFAERDGDVVTRIALRAKDLSSTWDVLKLAEFCRDQGREEEALRHVEEGLWLFEDEWLNERLVFLAVDLLLKAGRPADAEAYLWRAFEKAPSLKLYGRLRELGGAAVAERAIGFLRQKLASGALIRWHRPADLLARVLMEERMFDIAWDVARAHGTSQVVTRDLAMASEATHASQALAAYVERVEELVGLGSNSAYEEAAALTKRMSALRSAAEQAAYMAAIKARHGRKRNFMKVLG
ncbi:MAG: DUF6880 family protein [Pseudomonadota bacterium]